LANKLLQWVKKHLTDTIFGQKQFGQKHLANKLLWWVKKHLVQNNLVKKHLADKLFWCNLCPIIQIICLFGIAIICSKSSLGKSRFIELVDQMPVGQIDFDQKTWMAFIVVGCHYVSAFDQLNFLMLRLKLSSLTRLRQK
jgi:hypothetical protein